MASGSDFDADGELEMQVEWLYNEFTLLKQKFT
jgi:hypothetical protein